LYPSGYILASVPVSCPNLSQITIIQLGHVVNLLIAFSAATLGYVVNLVVGRQISVSWELWTVVLALFAAIAAGVVTNYSRLQDFRHSARAARCRELNGRKDLGESLTKEQETTISEYSGCHARAKWFGRVTWRAFKTQLVAFSLSYLILIHTLLTLTARCPKASAGFEAW